MTITHPPPPAAGNARPDKGLALASLVLGLLSVPLGLFAIGGLLGLVGLLLGFLHLRKPGVRKAMAVWGAALSLAGLLLGGFMTWAYVEAYALFKERMADAQGNAPRLEEWVGVPAPDFTVTTLDGASVTLSKLKGRRVVLDFWATWCPPCVKGIPHFIALHDEIPGDQLVIIGISDEDEDTLKPFAQKKGMNYPVASATGLPRPFSGLTAIPTTFFIDRNGIIQQAVVGYHDYAALKALALAADHAGAPRPAPEAATNRAGGASVTDGGP